MEMVNSRIGRSNSELHFHSSNHNKKWKDQRTETSPERNRVWTEPPPKHKSEKRVPVVYYLTRNGHLEHPHFVEVPLAPSSDGLYLRDVITRLNSLRGKCMASMYSWSSKRGYKNGFVWQDLEQNDFIYPAHGHEYVLKGSELLEPAFNPNISETPFTLTAGAQSPTAPETAKIGGVTDFPAVSRRRNQSWSAIDLHEYKVVYKPDSSGELSTRAAADASTQTEEKRRHVREVTEIVEENLLVSQSTELSREEISPPPSESSPETLESLMKAEGKLIISGGGEKDDLTANNHPSGRMKASTVLMQLVTCGSISFKDCGPGYTKNNPGFSLISQYKPRLPRGGRVEEEKEKKIVNNNNYEKEGKISCVVEDKEYFSGSVLQETKKDEFPALKRSSSYNVDRSSRMEVKDKETDGASGGCIPRRPRMQKPTINE